MKIASLNMPVAKCGTAEISMAPLIDIVFLLLIFFVVATVFPENSGINIEKPDSEHSGRLAKDQVIVLVDDHDQIYFGDKPVSPEDLKRILRDAYQSEPTSLLLIKADRHATTQALIKVMDAGKSAGIQQMGIATNEEPDAR
ncbi:MAG: biopolymer transporter ExbD [Pseudomonadota bacterium]